MSSTPAHGLAERWTVDFRVRRPRFSIHGSRITAITPTRPLRRCISSKGRRALVCSSYGTGLPTPDGGLSASFNSMELQTHRRRPLMARYPEAYCGVLIPPYRWGKWTLSSSPLDDEPALLSDISQALSRSPLFSGGGDTFATWLGSLDGVSSPRSLATSQSSAGSGSISSSFLQTSLRASFRPRAQARKAKKTRTETQRRSCMDLTREAR